MIYVNKADLSLIHHTDYQKYYSRWKDELFTSLELVETGHALLDESAPVGYRSTGRAVLNGSVYQREYVDQTPEQQINQAKATRDATKVSPLTVAIAGVDHVFDMDKEAQDNINNTIDEWAVVDAAAGGTGSIAWTLADNSELAVTLADLQAVRQAAVIRGLQLHVEYQAAKAALAV